MLDEESGVPGGEESTCKGPSSSSFTSDGVCKDAALKTKSKDEKMKAFKFYLETSTLRDLQKPCLSHRVFRPLIIFLRFAKLLLEGGGQLIEQTDLLTVLQKTCGSGGLVCQKTKKLSVLVDKNITFRHRLLYTIHLFRALTTSSAQINLKTDKWRCHYLQ